jgi:hypothetical protein
MRHVTTETRSPTWGGSDRYQEASELAFHDEAHAPTFAVNLGGRRNQYDLWPLFPDRAARGDNFVLVLDEAESQHPSLAALSPQFGSLQKGPLVALRRAGREISTRRIWILRSWRGGWPDRTAVP